MKKVDLSPRFTYKPVSAQGRGSVVRANLLSFVPPLGLLKPVTPLTGFFIAHYIYGID